MRKRFIFIEEDSAQIVFDIKTKVRYQYKILGQPVFTVYNDVGMKIIECYGVSAKSAWCQFADIACDGEGLYYNLMIKITE